MTDRICILRRRARLSSMLAGQMSACP
jgi:hypothetical protein